MGKWWVDITGMAGVGMAACGFEEKLKWEKYFIVLIKLL